MLRGPHCDLVIVRTSCDHLTGAVRQLLLPQVALAFAEDEQVLAGLAESGARLVVLHFVGSPSDESMAGRLVRAVPGLSAPIIALSERAGADCRDQPLGGFLNDVLHKHTDPWSSLLRAWALQPRRAPHLAVALRLLPHCAPPSLLPALESLALASDKSLSVKQWSSHAGVSRTRLHREIGRIGFTPSVLVDAVRSLHLVSPLLADCGVRDAGLRTWSMRRTERRVLLRTLGLSHTDIANAGCANTHSLRALILERLHCHFARSRCKFANTSAK